MSPWQVWKIETQVSVWYWIGQVAKAFRVLGDTWAEGFREGYNRNRNKEDEEK